MRLLKSRLYRHAYIGMHAPRLPGVPQTAPTHDEIGKPTEAPLPVACITSESKGYTCYTQQGTAMAVPRLICAEIVARLL